MLAMSSATASKKDEISSTRRRRNGGGGTGYSSSSDDQPVDIADEQNVPLSVVIESPVSTQARLLNEWLSSIMKEGGSEPGESSNNRPPKHKIQKVPEMFRQTETEFNKKYYEPLLVSIGPYHRDKAHLESFEKFKIQLTREYVKSCKLDSITESCNKFAEVACKARECYAEGTTAAIDDTSFIQMMFLDGCFIVQFMWCIVKRREEPLKMKSHDIALVQRDLFLLENQLPFKVLLELMNMNSSFDEWEGVEFIHKFIQNITGAHIKLSFLESLGIVIRLLIIRKHLATLFKYRPKRIDSDAIVDLLEYVWMKINEFDTLTHSTSSRRHYPRRSAMDLKMVGIHFRPDERDWLLRTRAMWDDQFCWLSYIRFTSTWNGGILTLPKINIDDTTVSLLLNIAAYEKCPDTAARYLCATNYICFLDSIIDSAADVKELKYAGVISNFLRNDQQVVEVIRGMATGLVPDYRGTSYAEVQYRIEEYHSHKGKTRIASWMAEVMRDHFRSPWTAIAVIAALFALFLSIIQTYFAVFPHNDKCQESICAYLKNNTLKNNNGGGGG